MSKKTTLKDFNQKVLKPYLEGSAEKGVVADELAAYSHIPPGTARARSFASVSHEFPTLQADKCIACMECVIACPDAAILARVSTETVQKTALATLEQSTVPKSHQEYIQAHFVKTQKFWDVFAKRGKEPGIFSLWIDPDKCKGCSECEAVCEHDAIKMQTLPDETEKEVARSSIEFIENTLPPTPSEFINDRLLVDLFLCDDKWVYRGGAGSCMGCGEITSLKMAFVATSAKYGKDMAVVAATGCNSVFSSTYPFNIFSVPWTNPLFENATTTALGVRLRLNQTGKEKTKLWAVGGDGAMTDIGFQALSRVLTTGEDIKILVLDTQSYSNTGGQASTATFMAQNAKMSACGRESTGKVERRKELGILAMMHPDVFVAQVSPAYYNHFLRAVLDALEYPGPAVILAYSPCMPEHGIADHTGFARAKEAVMSRAFPLFVHDPRKGKSFKERLNLSGNPSMNEDWHVDSKTKEVYDFIRFARNEGRFLQHFGKDEVSEALQKAQEERLQNWRTLRELATGK